MKLVVASNRLPVTAIYRDGRVEFREAVGGLATAINSFLRATERGRGLGFTKVLWVGWSGVKAELETDEVRSKLRERGLVPVPLSEEEVELFYEGFCNSTLWPLFHGFTVYTAFEKRFWDAYVRVNRRYAEAVASVADPGDFVWIHDYHLMLTPAVLRQLLPDLAVGFFLHIPFPPAEVYQLMPPTWRNALLEGVLAADLVGFHTYEYVSNFIRAVAKFLGYRAESGALRVGRRRVRVGAYPISIDYAFFHGSSQRAEVAAEIDELRQRLRGLKIVFSIDRLDYTKGVLNRLKAWERFLKEHPRWRGRAVFVLVVVPSRVGVPQYEAMKREIEREVGRINGELGEVDWTPVVYISRFIPTPTLLALYNIADVALITPLRDGMNLVAKEYVASRRSCTGVLILSETAGASHELLEALIVNPNDESGVAEAIARALEMDPQEQCRRIKTMQKRLSQHDVVKWAAELIHATALAYAENREAAYTKTPTPVDENTATEIAARFRASSRRLLLLDYDGTLVPHYPYAYQAVPDPELLGILKALSNVPNTSVAVVSGRNREFLESWLGDLPVYLVAEHGAFIRDVDKDWTQLFPFEVSWKTAVRKVMEDVVAATPGSYIEEKESAIAWHYRNVESELGETVAARLVEALESLLGGATFSVIRGSKVVEVRPAGVNKGAAAKLLLEKIAPDFVLAAGDDATDEDMFKALPEEAYTIKVGTGETTAKYNLPSHRELRELLKRLSSL
ncbi:bifunctional alpha,alpha-trehalose-phosphate synthase (UDP-forming)/trehalose-phosphatase [Pyrobaculum neutrophilum]|uniref:Alpha,alpha-trehalose-phosphate synthase n=1 Tax=Pyrobaculum neutrophilum (strain DSM 2338 / JCM 9278 / NBRC 100436 / V24Sta) TaxID=444157 RepID=B1YB94_PYRNV|nr:bifunctional alpha,alpha-trehalose-phosphate synthase (UDP-forming)/trehalose-phosphatase [Pyrobaculum neutrophilum]ACB39225.1 alpha,alpha-trehalose-phosphate synthase (UDP-forming) [Pyrobaculum neutrophilum V24Sta]